LLSLYRTLGTDSGSGQSITDCSETLEIQINIQYSMKEALYFMILLIVLSSCGRKTNFTISGQLNGGAGKTIYLNRLLINNQPLTDSAKLNSEGKFVFKGRTSSPAFYLLKLSNSSFVTLLVDSAETAIIKGSYKNFTRDYKVTGSSGSEVLRDLDNRFFKAKAELDSIQKLYDSHKNDPLYASKTAEWIARYNGITVDHSNYVTA